MKTISPDIVFFVVFIGNGIHIRLPGHSGVERSIKYHALRDLRPKDFPACTDTIQFGAVMQRRQRNQAFNAFYNVLVYQQRLIENRAALGHPMTYSRNFTKLCNNAVFAIHQSFCNKTESIRMILHFRGGFYLPAVKGLMAENPLLHPDSFTVSFCQHAFSIHINELIFKRRTARIDDQYLHVPQILLLFIFLPFPKRLLWETSLA